MFLLFFIFPLIIYSVLPTLVYKTQSILTVSDSADIVRCCLIYEIVEPI